MKLKYLIIFIMLLASCEGEFNPSELRIFDYGAGFSYRTLPNGKFEVRRKPIGVRSQLYTINGFFAML